VLLGTRTDIPAGYLEVRYTVTVESDASEEELMQMFDEADNRSPYLDVFTRGQKCVRHINIVSAKKTRMMEPALQRRVQRYGWDKASSLYEGLWQKQLQPAQTKLLEYADIHAGEKVIDIACGTGLVSLPAAEKAGGSGFVLGTDISDKMVELASSLAKEKKFSWATFEQMDAEELKVNDGTYDIALCALGLMYFPDPLKALKEMFRVLKPGGRAVAAVWGRRSSCGWAEVFEIVDRRVASEVCPMFFNTGNPECWKNILRPQDF
jgi:SAM-dependent methyltransferase